MKAMSSEMSKFVFTSFHVPVFPYISAHFHLYHSLFLKRRRRKEAKKKIQLCGNRRDNASPLGNNRNPPTILVNVVQKVKSKGDNAMLKQIKFLALIQKEGSWSKNVTWLRVNGFIRKIRTEDKTNSNGTLQLNDELNWRIWREDKSEILMLTEYFAKILYKELLNSSMIGYNTERPDLMFNTEHESSS